MSRVRFIAASCVAVVIPPLLSQVNVVTPAVAQSFGTNPESFPIPSSLPDGETLRLDGSTSMELTNEALESRFEAQYPNVDVQLEASRTDNALQALLADSLDLVASGRPLTEAERAQGLAQTALQREKLAIILGPDNPFEGNLSFEQFAQIFRGDITNWSEVGGPDRPIRVVDRPDYSDTRRALSTYTVFAGRPFQTGATADPVAVDETDAVIDALGADGIGYAVVSQVEGQAAVRILSMHGTLPDDPRYPYSQYRSYVYQENTESPATLAFLGFATTPPGQEVIVETAAGATGETAGAEAEAATSDPATSDPATTAAASAVDAEAASAEEGSEAAAGAIATGAAGDTPELSDSGVSDGDETAAIAENSETAQVPTTVTTGETEQGGFPWWLLLLLGLPLLGALLWWLLKDQQDDPAADANSAAVGPAGAGATAAGTTPAETADSSPVSSTPATLAPGATVGQSAAAVPGATAATAASSTVPSAPAGAQGDRSAAASTVTGPALGLGAAVAGAAGLVGAAALRQSDQSKPVTLTAPAADTVKVTWQVPSDRIEEIKLQGGVQPKVRLYDMTHQLPDAPLPVPVVEADYLEGQSELALSVPTADRDYMAAVGYLTADDRWLPLAQSESVRLAMPEDSSGGLSVTGAMGAGIATAGVASVAGGLVKPDDTSDVETRDADVRAAATGDAATGLAPVADSEGLGESEISLPDVTLPGVASESIAADDTPLSDAGAQAAGRLESGAVAGDATRAVSIEDGYSDLDTASEVPLPADLPVGPVGVGTAALGGIAAAAAGSVSDGAVEDGAIALTLQDPQTGVATWNIPVAAQEEAKTQGGKRYQLRIYDVTDIDLDSQPAHRVDVYDCDEGDHNRSVPLLQADRDYLAEVGYETDDNRWLMLARSTHLSVPLPQDEVVAAMLKKESFGGGSDPEPLADSVGEANLPGDVEALGVVPMPLAAATGGAAALGGLAAATLGQDQSSDAAAAHPIGLMLRSDQTALASWQVSAAAMAAAKAQGGKHYQLRLYDVTAVDLDTRPAHRVDVYGCGEAEVERVVPIPQVDRDYLAEVGYETDDNRWIRLARSLHVHVPADHGVLTSDESAISLLPQTPRAAIAGWRVSQTAQTAAKAEGGEHYQLRLYDVTAIDLDTQHAHRVDIYPCDDGDQARTVIIPQTGRDYLVEIGYETGDHRWLKLARSTYIHMPPADSQTSALVAAAPQGPVPEISTEVRCTVQTVSVEGGANGMPLVPTQQEHLKTTAATYPLEPGLYILRIRAGTFNYDGDEGHPGEPFVVLWIYGGKVINQKTQVPVDTTWSTLNGYADTLTLTVRSRATLAAFFLDTFPDDNAGEVTLSLIRLSAETAG